MILHPETDKKLNKWLSQSAWHSSHPTEEKMFFDFVDQYVTDHGCTMNDNDMSDKFIAVAKIADHQPKIDIANDRVRSMRQILDFLKATGRSE